MRGSGWAVLVAAAAVVGLGSGDPRSGGPRRDVEGLAEEGGRMAREEALKARLAREGLERAPSGWELARERPAMEALARDGLPRARAGLAMAPRGEELVAGTTGAAERREATRHVGVVSEREAAGDGEREALAAGLAVDGLSRAHEGARLAGEGLAMAPRGRELAHLAREGLSAIDGDEPATTESDATGSGEASGSYEEEGPSTEAYHEEASSEEEEEMASEAAEMAPAAAGMAFRAMTMAAESLPLSRPRPRAATPSGRTYLGQTLYSASGRRFAAFSGIRYARPLHSRTRFKEAEPLGKSTEDVEALEEGQDCLQLDVVQTPPIFSGSDDCLFLNVYSPKVSPDELLPVMVWIHGGGFRSGSGSSSRYGPQILMDKDVVLVTINYRLGAIGFSSLEDDVHPGNLGLKDQKLSIEWVKGNIEGFGGDPKRITLFGYSAGGACVNFHMIFSNSKGLFQGGISQSGSAMSPWGLSKPGSVRARTVELARGVGCRGNDSHALVDCLSTKSGEDLLKGILEFGVIDRMLLPFRPVVEGRNGLVTYDPGDMNVIRPSVPWIVGTTSGELAYFTSAYQNFSESLLPLLDVFYDAFGPRLLMIPEGTPEPSRVAKAIRYKYFQDSRMTEDNLGSLVKMVGDAWFTYPTFKSLIYNKGKVYHYYFDHVGKVNRAKAMGCESGLGAAHGEEVPYLFQDSEVNIMEKGSEDDRLLSRKMLDLWTNFAAHGDPNPVEGVTWKPWTLAAKESLYIGPKTVVLVRDVLGERMRFWESLGLEGRRRGAERRWGQKKEEEEGPPGGPPRPERKKESHVYRIPRRKLRKEMLNT